MTDLRERVKAAIEKALYSEEAMATPRTFDEQMSAAADAAIAEAFKWLPIETAPKNETVLVDDRPYMFTACYSADLPGWTDGSDDDCGGISIFYPTHWMPLPPPPAKGGK